VQENIIIIALREAANLIMRYYSQNINNTRMTQPFVSTAEIELWFEIARVKSEKYIPQTTGAAQSVRSSLKPILQLAFFRFWLLFLQVMVQNCESLTKLRRVTEDRSWFYCVHILQQLSFYANGTAFYRSDVLHFF